MCGIAGLIGGEPKSISISKLKQSLQHRGPDNFGEYYSNDLNSVSLWHSRLSIIDLKSESNQPFFSFDKRFVIVFNGEIYNHKKLKETLISLGYSFRTDSDTEVLFNYLIYMDGFNNLQNLNSKIQVEKKINKSSDEKRLLKKMKSEGEFLYINHFLNNKDDSVNNCSKF